MAYDIAVWEAPVKEWKKMRQLKDPKERLEAYMKLQMKKIFGAKLPYIPQKESQIQIDHNSYEVVQVSYDLGDDQITLLVVER